ncbi:LCP family protein [Paenibacillus endoradicis]|uniref:LCP family protein n=1 Tax=Paenibacillus endoradicis TaxID=2972487 RepID=UPI0021590956|nr:LCP family protein [Paenibacillus endoradicis]
MNKQISKNAQPQPTESRVTSRGTRKQKKSKKKIIITTILSIIIIIVAVVVLFGTYIVNKVNSKFPEMSIVTEQEGEPNSIAPIAKGESVKDKPVTLVLLGIDQRKGGGGLNTDVMLVAALNPITKKGAVIAMPRDTRISYYSKEKDAVEVRKANAFYANYYVKAQKDGEDKNGAMLKGKAAVRDVLGQFYDIPIQYAVSVNFQGFRDVVDVLGGIHVDVDMRMKWTDSHDDTDIDLQPGPQTLNGKQTLDFVRFRQSKANPNASSDFERNNRQSIVLSAIMKKMISLGGITKIGDVIDEVSDDVYTDMPTSELTRMLSTYYNINMDNITFMSLQGKWDNPYVIASEESLAEAKQLLQSILAE